MNGLRALRGPLPWRSSWARPLAASRHQDAPKGDALSELTPSGGGGAQHRADRHRGRDDE